LKNGQGVTFCHNLHKVFNQQDQSEDHILTLSPRRIQTVSTKFRVCGLRLSQSNMQYYSENLSETVTVSAVRGEAKPFK